MGRTPIVIKDKESFCLDKILDQVKARKKEEKLKKKSKGGQKNG